MAAKVKISCEVANEREGECSLCSEEFADTEAENARDETEEPFKRLLVRLTKTLECSRSGRQGLKLASACLALVSEHKRLPIKMGSEKKERARTDLVTSEEDVV